VVLGTLTSASVGAGRYRSRFRIHRPTMDLPNPPTPWRYYDVLSNPHRIEQKDLADETGAWFMGPISGRQSDMIFALDCMAGRFGASVPKQANDVESATRPENRSSVKILFSTEL
jgi:hypothetical protein